MTLRNVFPRTKAWRYLDWEVCADGYRLVIEHGVMIGLAYDEWPYPWGDERYLASELVFDGEIRRVTGQPHRCGGACGSSRPRQMEELNSAGRSTVSTCRPGSTRWTAA